MFLDGTANKTFQSKLCFSFYLYIYIQVEEREISDKYKCYRSKLQKEWPDVINTEIRIS